MRHRNKSGQFVSNEEVRDYTTNHYKAFDDTPPHVQLLGLNYWPQLGDALRVDATITDAYNHAKDMANEIARVRAFDFFQQLLIVALGLYVVSQSDFRVADLWKDIPRNWGEVLVGLATLVALYVKCLWRGGQLRARHDTFVKVLGLPTREALTQP